MCADIAAEHWIRCRRPITGAGASRALDHIEPHRAVGDLRAPSPEVRGQSSAGFPRDQRAFAAGLFLGVCVATQILGCQPLCGTVMVH